MQVVSTCTLSNATVGVLATWALEVLSVRRAER